MPTTFANTINGNELLAKRSQCDYAGNDLQTTYATKSDVTTGLASKEDSANKAQSIDTSSTTDFPSSKATADFVNSSVATNTAKFLGNFTLTDLSLTYPATDAQIETALDGYTFSPAPTNNDYVYVEIQDPQTPGVTDVVKRFKFDGTNWLYEYSLNNSSFTAAEIAAIDSGINSTKVGNYDTHIADTDIHVTLSDKSTWNGKQDAISDLATIRSGAALGATALQDMDVSRVALTGSYADLLNKPTIPTATSDLNNDSGFITLSDVPAQVNADWNSSSGASEILNKPTIPSGTQLVPAATSADANKVLTVDAQGVPGWAAGGTGGNNVFMAISTTTFPELWQAYHVEGKLVYCEDGSGNPPGPTPYFLQSLKADDSSYTTGVASFVQFNRYSTGRIEAYHAEVSFNVNHPTLGTVNFTRQTIVPDNPQSHVGEFLAARSDGGMIFASVNQVPASTSSDADKVLTVDSQGTPGWASAQAPISAGTGIDITNNVVSVDTSVVATQTDLADKEDAFDVGTGLELDTSGATPTLQVEAPVDIVAGPGIVIDNPDGNTLRVSVAQAEEVVLFETTTPTTGTVAPITLSESIYNFEKIKIVGRLNGNGSVGAPMEWEWYTNDIPVGSRLNCFGVPLNDITNPSLGVYIRNSVEVVSNGTSLTHEHTHSWQLQGNSLMPQSTDVWGQLRYFRVVGIHRIASN